MTDKYSDDRSYFVAYSYLSMEELDRYDFEANRRGDYNEVYVIKEGCEEGDWTPMDVCYYAILNDLDTALRVYTDVLLELASSNEGADCLWLRCTPPGVKIIFEDEDDGYALWEKFSVTVPPSEFGVDIDEMLYVRLLEKKELTTGEIYIIVKHLKKAC